MTLREKQQIANCIKLRIQQQKKTKLHHRRFIQVLEQPGKQER